MTEQEAIEELKCYRAQSGTSYPEEIEVVIVALEEIQQYRKIGTPKECGKAVEKQRAKKPIDRCMFSECPNCGNVEIQYCTYCPNCGQKLDWSEEE